MDGFDVDTERLRQLAAAFHRESGTLEARTSAFRAEARRVDDAFGVLGASDEVYQAYIAKLEEFVGGLCTLQASLAAVSETLLADADAYDRADALVAS
jgi:uncharacterized protein YukE